MMEPLNTTLSVTKMIAHSARIKNQPCTASASAVDFTPPSMTNTVMIMPQMSVKVCEDTAPPVATSAARPPATRTAEMNGTAQTM